MKKAILAVVIAVLAVVGITAALIAHDNSGKPVPSSDTSTSGMDMGGNNSGTSNKPSNSATPVATSSVSIKNFSFSPANITVKKGTTVTWTNNDSTAHTVASSSDGPNSGGVIQPGGTYTFTFSQTGTFAYHCGIHPEMTGTVVVTE